MKISFATPLRRRLSCGLASMAMLLAATPAAAKTILFVGNSFTFGAFSPVYSYRPDLVTDLNGTGMSGVPALFKTFADEAKLDWNVSIEASPGKDLGWHVDNRRATIDRTWDAVVLQNYSTLDPRHPGDPAIHTAMSCKLARMFRARNPAVQVNLESTWSRADQTYTRAGAWFGKSIQTMALDIARATQKAVDQCPELSGGIPVGAAWNRAMEEGVADPDPYDGISFGKIDLWTWDHFHASAAGYYLSALVIFGRVTGQDPRQFGAREVAAEKLGLQPETAVRLQEIAAETLKLRE